MLLSRMKISKLSAIVIALSVAMGATFVTAAPQLFSNNVKVEYKPTKEVKKQAKKYEKEGWKVAFGAMPMAEQLQRAIYFQKEVDANGLSKYAVGRGQSEAQYYDAARMQAMELARLDVASQFETSITAEAKSILGNEQGETVASVLQTSKGVRSLVSQNLSQTILVTEIHKEIKGGGYIVQISVAADREQGVKAAKRAIREDLKKRGDEIVKKLDEQGWDK